MSRSPGEGSPRNAETPEAAEEGFLRYDGTWRAWPDHTPTLLTNGAVDRGVPRSTHGACTPRSPAPRSPSTPAPPSGVLFQDGRNAPPPRSPRSAVRARLARRVRLGRGSGSRPVEAEAGILFVREAFVRATSPVGGEQVSAGRRFRPGSARPSVLPIPAPRACCRQQHAEVTRRSSRRRTAWEKPERPLLGRLASGPRQHPGDARPGHRPPGALRVAAKLIPAPPGLHSLRRASRNLG